MGVPGRAVCVAICLTSLHWSACNGGGVQTTPPGNPTPSISSLSPSGAYSGFGGFPLIVDGSGFISSSTIQWNGSNRATTFVSQSRLTTVIPGPDIAVVGMISVTVTTPAPGGGISNVLTFKVAPGPAPGTGVVQLISAASDGSPSSGNTFTPPSISATGRFVAFPSDATNLVPGSASGFADIYVRDTCIGVLSGCVPSTARVSVATDGTLANGNSRSPSISADGRFVAFDSSATNLVPGGTNNPFFRDVYVRDTCLGVATGCTPTTTRVSVASDGTQADAPSDAASISDNGRFVAFESGATNLIVGDTNVGGAVVRDTCNGAPVGCTPATTRVSVATDGTLGNSGGGLPSISALGRFVAFVSFATNLVPGDSNGVSDVFVRDTCFGAQTGCTPSTVRVSVASDGTQGNDTIFSTPSIDVNGRFVAFDSFATNLVPGDTNGLTDVFYRDTCVGVSAGCTLSTIRVSVAFDDIQANEGSGDPSVSADGRLVAFDSLATNLIYGGSAAPKTVFLRDTCIGAPTGCITTTILLARRTADGLGGNGIDTNPVISADGRFAVFLSNATNLLPGGSNGSIQVYLAKTGF